MKRSPRSVKIALSAAAVASGLACAVPAFAAPYITIDVLARDATANPSKYQLANGSGYTPLPGFNPVNGENTTTGFTSSVTPTSVNQAYEILLRVTLATQGTVNTFATGFTSIVNWNPSSNSTFTSGISGLKFNLTQATTGIQVSMSDHLEGKNTNLDPNGDGTIAGASDPRVFVDRVTVAQNDGAPASGINSNTNKVWDQNSAYNGGTLTPRGNGFMDVTSVALQRANGSYSGIGGTNAAPVPAAFNTAVAYFTIGALGATTTLSPDFGTAIFPGTTSVALMRWLNTDTDGTGVNVTILANMQAASLAGNDAIIKVNGLVINGSAPATTPAAIVANPVSGSNLNTNGHVTLTNTAVGASVDAATLSVVNITSSLPANATWAQHTSSAFTNGQSIAAGSPITNTVLVTPAANLLAGAKGDGQLTFTVNAPAGATGTGAYSYNLKFTNASNAAPTGAGTTFGTAQTAAVAAGDKVAGLSTTEVDAGTFLNTFTFLDSTTVGAGGATASAAWRHRSSREVFPGQRLPLPLNISSLITDVVDVHLTGNVPQAYVLQLNYDEAGLGGISEVTSFNADHLYLAHLSIVGGDGQNGSADDEWKNATLDSGSPKAGVMVGFAASGISDLNANIGAWGVDTVANVAWAILPGSVQGQFAIVPEPASLGLLALGALGLMTRRRR